MRGIHDDVMIGVVCYYRSYPSQATNAYNANLFRAF